MTCCAVLTRFKGRGHKRSTVEKTRRNGWECNNRIRDRDLKEQLRLRKERTSGRIFRKTVELETEKRVVGSSTGLREVSDWTSWEVRPLRIEGRDIKAQPSVENKNDGGTPGPSGILSGNHSGRAALRREQLE
jgi:hypothetical protein